MLKGKPMSMASARLVRSAAGLAAILVLMLVQAVPALAETGTQDMYRCYNPNSGEHFYTANEGERDNIVSLGWRYEGTGWVAPATSDTPVYRLYNPNAGDHFYTSSLEERDWLVSLGWNYEGIGWYSAGTDKVPLYRQYNPNAKTGTHNYTTAKTENDSLVAAGWKAEGIGWYAVKEGTPIKATVEGVDGNKAQPVGTGSTIGTGAPASHGDPGNAYKAATIKLVSQAGSKTDYAYVVDCKLARLTLLKRSGGTWTVYRSWVCNVGRNGKTDAWAGNHEVQHKDGDAGSGPDANPWFTVWEQVRIPASKGENANGWRHADGTAEGGNGFHASWQNPTDWNQNPSERKTTAGGVLVTRGIALWIYDNTPIGTRVCVVRSVI